MLGLAAAAPAIAAPAYDYPIEEPLAATVVGTPEAYRAALPSTAPLAEHSLPPLVERDVPTVLHYARSLHYGLAAQDGQAPLVFLVAGTGAGHKGGRTDILVRALYDIGFHVVVLPSTTTVSFMLNAATHPVPGRMPADVADLYRLMQAIDERLAPELEITGYHLAGISLGATQAAFLAHHDETAGAFGFRRVLLVNPAVNVYRSVRRVDAMLVDGLPRGIAGLPAFLEQTLGQLKRVYAGGEPLRFEEDFLYRAYLQVHPDRANLAGLVGLAFRLSLANMAFAADLLAETGVIVAPDVELDISDSLEPYLVRAFDMSFADYIDRLLLPYHQRQSPALTREALVAEADLTRIAGYLRQAEHIGVVSNRREPILDADELAFLRTTFGDRAFIYPRGGHLGNLAQHQTVRDIQGFMAP